MYQIMGQSCVTTMKTFVRTLVIISLMMIPACTIQGSQIEEIMRVCYPRDGVSVYYVETGMYFCKDGSSHQVGGN